MRIAWRLFFRNKQVNLINLFGLSIGLCTLFYLFGWCYQEWTFDHQHKAYEQIFRLTSLDRANEKIDRVPYVFADLINDELPEVAYSTRVRGITGILPSIQVADYFHKENKAAYIDENWFQVFDYHFVAGSALEFNQHPKSLILSEHKAASYFGDAKEVLGKVVKVNGEDYTVRGIVSDNAANSSFQYEVFIPVAARHLDPFWKDRDLNLLIPAYSTYVKFRNIPKDVPSKTASIQQVINKLFTEEKTTVSLTSLQDLHFEQSQAWTDVPNKGNKALTQSIFVLGILILIIVAINYINLTTAKTISYTKSISIRKIVGASRFHIVKQLFSESSLMAMLTLTLSGCLIVLIQPLLEYFFQYQFTFSLSHILIGLGTWILLLVLSITYPIVLFSAFPSLSNHLKSKGNIPNTEGKRKLLIGFQLCTAIFLITCSIGILLQMNYIESFYKKYDYERIISIQLPFKQGEQWESRKGQFKQALQGLSQVEKVSIGSNIIDEDNADESFEWSGKEEKVNYQLNTLSADENFKQVYQIDLIEGNWFNTMHNNARQDFILNETAVRKMGLGAPVLGKKITYNGIAGEIVAIVKDFPFQHLQKTIKPLIITNNQTLTNTIVLKVKDESYSESIKSIKSVYTDFYADEPLEIHQIKELVNKTYLADQKVMNLAWTSTLAAVLVSILGLYGMSIYNLERRNKEISIRKVLGSSVWRIFKTLTKDYFLMVILSLLISIPFSLIAIRSWLTNFAYKIEIEWWIFVSAGMLILLITFLSISFQTLKSAYANPVDALKEE